MIARAFADTCAGHVAAEAGRQQQERADGWSAPVGGASVSIMLSRGRA